MDNPQSSWVQPSERNYDEGILVQALTPHLMHLYPSHAAEVMESVLAMVRSHLPMVPEGNGSTWDERDVMLVTYGDTIKNGAEPPLKTLSGFLESHVPGCFTCLHVLPYFPYSSDDGFSVIDYRIVDPDLGSWEDIRRLSGSYRFMSDLVINHVSRHSVWFADFVGGHPPGNEYFIEPSPDDDLSKVVRPRNSSLLAPVWTRRGIRHVWATFSKDQIDLNFKNPDVLLEMIGILLLYMEQGTSLVRMDAVAFLWKESGSSCIHLPQTHTIVKILRIIMGTLRSDSVVLTETNVPHEENMSYLGDGDEAQMVYQFPLPPLILHAMNRGTAEHLTSWAATLPDYAPGCTVLNFTASHDGIGLRPLEGIIPEREVDDLVESMHQFGGFVSMRALPDGTQKPYEINISLFDALRGTRRGEDIWQIPRLLCSQAIMLAMRGVPAVYIHSLFATENDLELVEQTGRTRSINRKKWDLEELESVLENPVTPQATVFRRMQEMLKVRRTEPCFHPDNSQRVFNLQSGLFVFLRAQQNSQRKLLAVNNVTSAPLQVDLSLIPALAENQVWKDILTGNLPQKMENGLIVEPYQVLWLVNEVDD